VQGPSNFCDPDGIAVKAVDVENGTITFDDRANPNVAGRTFTLAKDVNIVIDGKAGKLSAVTPGTLVSIRLWVVTAVDVARHTITVGDKIDPVAKDANIQIDGKPAKLAGVPAGMSVALRLNVDRKTVGTILQVSL
jgi:hypothetical protein